MKLYIVIFFSLITFLNSYSQNDTIYVFGRVVDTNAYPIESVNILNLRNKTGAFTNSNGFFYTSADDFPVDLRISRIGFDTKYLSLTKSEFESIDDFITIQLSGKVYTLEEVEIINNKPDMILSNQANRIILDFKIFEESLLVLLKIGQSRMLKVFNVETLTSFEVGLSIRGDGLFEDCMGNIHILTSDSVYQIESNFSDSALIFYEPYSKVKFDNSLKDCVGYFHNNFIFKSIFNHNQKVVYWYPTATKQKELYSIYDQERELFAQNFLDRKNELIRQYGVFDEMGEISVGQLEILRKIKQLEFGYQFLGRIPAYNPLFISFETILIFDNLHNRIVFFDSAFSFQKAVTMHYKTNNSQRVYHDKATGSFYLEGLSLGNNVFYEIELETGRTIKTIKIDNSIFPEKVCFYRDKIYYIGGVPGSVKSLKILNID
jgi:hypothetical protein